jgi:hypothetical protein
MVGSFKVKDLAGNFSRSLSNKDLAAKYFGISELEGFGRKWGVRWWAACQEAGKWGRSRLLWVKVWRTGRRSRIRTSFVSRAARGCAWSVKTRPRMLIGRSRIP